MTSGSEIRAERILDVPPPRQHEGMILPLGPSHSQAGRSRLALPSAIQPLAPPETKSHSSLASFEPRTSAGISVLPVDTAEDRRGPLPSPAALVIAFLAEFGAICGCVWSWNRPAPPIVSAPIEISLMSFPAPEPPRAPPKPQPEVKTQVRPPDPQVRPIVRHLRPPKQRVQPEQSAPLAAPSPPIETSPPPPDTSGAFMAFESAVKNAVQAALAYPGSARMLRQQGRAGVSFDYLDGTASNVTLVQTSGFPILDKAAVATVESAQYPEAPAPLQHKTLHLAVAVEFKLSGGE